MKWSNIIVVIVLLALVGGFFLYRSRGEAGPEQTFTVDMKDDGFFPADFTISKNTTVVWVNNGTIPHWPASDFHPTHGIYPEFDPLKGIPVGEAWTFKFDKKGSWHFHDHLNPSLRGTARVE